MKLNSFFRLSFNLVLLTVLISFESTFGLPWLSIFFIQQLIVRSSNTSAWVIIIMMSFFLSTAFTNSLLLVFGFLIFLWIYQDIRSLIWWILYLVIVFAVSYQSFMHFSWEMAGQTSLSLIFLIFYSKGIIWWPKVWKNNEKIT